jgi:hypothetical protein
MRIVDRLSSQITVESRCLNPNDRSNDRKYKTSQTSEHSTMYATQRYYALQPAFPADCPVINKIDVASIRV